MIPHPLPASILLCEAKVSPKSKPNKSINYYIFYIFAINYKINEHYIFIWEWI